MKNADDARKRALIAIKASAAAKIIIENKEDIRRLRRSMIRSDELFGPCPQIPPFEL